MSDTPRTDAKVAVANVDWRSPGEWVRADISRQLERELTAALARAEQAERERDLLAEGIAKAAKHISIYNGEVPVTGSELLLLLQNMADSYNALRLAYDRAREASEMLWVVLVNVSGGDWTQQSAEWQEAAKKWADNYHQVVRSSPATWEREAKAMRRVVEAAKAVLVCFSPEHIDYVSSTKCGSELRDALAAAQEARGE